MTLKSKIVWKEGLAFDAHLDGFTFVIDSPADPDRKMSGPGPKGLIPLSLAGCTGMDVISLLRKMRQPVDRFEVAAEAETAGEHPKKILRIRLTYSLEGKAIAPDSVRRAVELSETKYCGVRATLAPTVHITHSIIINGQILPE